MLNRFARYCRVAGALCSTILAMAAPISHADESESFFEAKVRPLLVAKCLECHGENEPEAGLKLTSREHVLKGGDSGPAAIAKLPKESLLIKVVNRKGPIKMPPDEKLTVAEVQTLEKWVELALPWPKSGGLAPARKEFAITAADRQHWSFQPVATPKIPIVKDKAWPKTPIDRFILSKLEESGIKPSASADRRTLLRRATYDLTGLPPTWEEMRSFTNDPAPTDQAFEKLLDRLLASPRYGERWGRHWLDVARFADSKDGVLMYGDDRIRPYAYTYRDYVIRALNEDTPFDQFVREQLAADLIQPKVPTWRMAALGYLTLGRMYDNNIHDIIDDQIDTVSRGFLGLTVACARCHDHKYDPVSTADYYSLYGVFASSEAPQELPLTVNSIAPEAKEFEKQASAKRDEIRSFRDKQFELLSETARQRVGDYLERVATTRPDPLETAIFFLSLAPEDLRPPIIARVRKYIDQRATDNDPVFGIWHDLMESMPLEDPKSAGPKASPDVKSIDLLTKKWKSRPAGTKNGQINPLVRDALLQAKPKTRAEVARAYGSVIKKTYDESKLKTVTAVTPEDSEARRQIVEMLTSRESPLYFSKSQTRRYMSRTETDQFGGKVQELDRMAVKSPVAPPRAMSLVDAESPYEPHIFVRGNPTAPGRKVPRRFIELLSEDGVKPFSKGSGRLELANKIASPANPLTARVIVNRAWMHHFGEPLVASPSDFGKRVNAPVHAELLDHLASQFISDGWSLKKLHRRIMLSAVYQQQSVNDMESLASNDSENRLFSHTNRQRLSFEAMRDTLLAVSGRIEQRGGGGRPVDITDPQSRCRSVFGMVDRQSLPGVFRAFDFATPDQSVERRVRTMGPQQALFALNSPFVIEQAKALAGRSEVSSIANPTDRVKAMYQIVLQRLPEADEISASVEFVSQPKDDSTKLSVWEQLAQVLLSSNELMYID